MAYSIEYSTQALVFLQALPDDVGDRLFNAIDLLSENPRPKGSLRVKRGRGEVFSFRIDSYVVAYEIREQRLVIIILAVKPKST